LHNAASQRQGGELHFSALNVTSDSREGLSRALKEASKHVSSIVEQKLHVNVCSLLVYLLQVPWLAQIYPYLQINSKIRLNCSAMLQSNPHCLLLMCITAVYYSTSQASFMLPGQRHVGHSYMFLPGIICVRISSHAEHLFFSGCCQGALSIVI